MQHVGDVEVQHGLCNVHASIKDGLVVKGGVLRLPIATSLPRGGLRGG